VIILLKVLYFFVCAVLIIVVLLQHGKGADIGVSLGAGSSNTVFGARGAGNFLTKLTTACAILFMILAFSLARFAADDSAEDLLSVPAGEAPAVPQEAAPPLAVPESSAPPSEPGGAPSGFESIETPATPPADAPKPDAPAPAPTKPPS
jgi:preprotein translocase subunit SecG